MSESFDMSAYLDVFMVEADEQLNQLEESLVELEKKSSPEMLQELFRAAHTLKGASASMGFTRIAELTHGMENVLDALRNEEIGLSTEIVDVLLRALDTLMALRQGLEEGAEPDVDTSALRAKLGEIIRQARGLEAPAVEEPKGVGGLAFGDHEKAAIALARERELQVYVTAVTLKSGCPMKGIRAALVVNAVEKHGEVIKTEPDAESIECEKFGDVFSLVVVTGSPTEAVREAIDALSEIERIDIRPLEAGEEDTAPPAAPEPKAPGPGLALREHEQVAVELALEQRLNVFVTVVKLKPNTPLKGIRAALAVGKVEELGDVIKTVPDPDDLEQEKFGNEFSLVAIVQSSAADVKAAVESLGDIEEAVVTPLAAPTQRPAIQPVAASAAPPSAPVADEAPTPDAAPDAAQTVVRRQSTVRVNVEQLDNLMNLVAELVIDRTVLEQIRADLQEQVGRQSELGSRMDEAVTRIGRRTTDLQDEIMKARMQPVDMVFSRFPRMLRDLAHKANKKVDFQIFGGETELDRSVLEVIGDPLIHMLRNSVDHGIETPEARAAAGKPETGSVTLSARHEENYIVIEVDDDGKGIDPEKVKARCVERGVITPEVAERMSSREAMELIFASGFSTAEEITDVSGRGVGMDIVKTNVERLNGRIDISSVPGEGTTMAVRLPLTLAIIQALLIRAQGRNYAVALTCVQETERRALTEVQTIQGAETVVLRDRVLPLIRFDWAFDYNRAAPATAAGKRDLYIVVVQVGDREAGIVVDELIGEQEIVIKSLGNYIGDVRGISGATILGDGTVALIVDAGALLDSVTEMQREAFTSIQQTDQQPMLEEGTQEPAEEDA